MDKFKNLRGFLNNTKMATQIRRCYSIGFLLSPRIKISTCKRQSENVCTSKVTHSLLVGTGKWQTKNVKKVNSTVKKIYWTVQFQNKFDIILNIFLHCYSIGVHFLPNHFTFVNKVQELYQILFVKIATKMTS